MLVVCFLGGQTRKGCELCWCCSLFHGMWEGNGGRATWGKVSLYDVLRDSGAYKVNYTFKTQGKHINTPTCVSTWNTTPPLTVLCLKVRNEAKEPLRPWGQTGRQTAGRSVVRMSSPMFIPHLSSRWRTCIWGWFVVHVSLFYLNLCVSTVSDALPSFTGRCFV